MLEKSRVVHQGSDESNFHIFYKFLAGLTEEDRIFLSINKDKKYRLVPLAVLSQNRHVSSE